MFFKRVSEYSLTDQPCAQMNAVSPLLSLLFSLSHINTSQTPEFILSVSGETCIRTLTRNQFVFFDKHKDFPMSHFYLKPTLSVKPRGPCEVQKLRLNGYCECFSPTNRLVTHYTDPKEETRIYR